jgi:hypothetical protein
VTVPESTLPLRDLEDWLALLPPLSVCLSPMQVRLLLRVTLPQPLFDRPAAVVLIAYQQRHKLAAYLSHRTRRLRQALFALPATIPRPGTAHDHVPLLSALRAPSGASRLSL